MSGKKINVGKIPILKLNSNAWIETALLSTTDGKVVKVEIKDSATAIDSPIKMNQLYELGDAYPNPFSNQTTVPYYLSKDVDCVYIEIRNIVGEMIKTWKIDNCISGNHQIVWNEIPSTGMYFCMMRIISESRVSGNQTKKLIVQ